MTEETPLEHGGDLKAASERFGEPSAGWLDLSTGISPDAYPLPPLPLDAWTRLPDAQREDRLIEAARGYYGAEKASIVAAPGSQALIGALAETRPPSRVAILAPTYAEHAYRWRAAGHEVEEVAADDIPSGIDVCIAVNPNNPDGRLLARGTLMALYQRLAGRGGWLIIDEAFADLKPDASVADWCGEPGIVVLRSFGKFFGLAGVRLGFALTEKATARDLRHRLGPWAVSGPALAIGQRALSDSSWIGEHRHRLRQQADALDALLAGVGLKRIGGTALFRFVAHPKAEILFEGLAREGVLTRSFREIPGTLRIGLPGDHNKLERLEAALTKVMANL